MRTPNPSRPSPFPLRAVVGGIGLVVALLCSVVVAGRLRHLRILRARRRSLVQGASQRRRLRSTSTPTSASGNTSACGWPSSSSCRKTTMGPCGSGCSTAPGRWCSKKVRQFSGPSLRRSAPIIVKGVVVGRVEAEASLFAVLCRGRLGNALQLRAGAGRLSGFPGRAPARPRPHARRARDARTPGSTRPSTTCPRASACSIASSGWWSATSATRASTDCRPS